MSTSVNMKSQMNTISQSTAVGSRLGGTRLHKLFKVDPSYPPCSLPQTMYQLLKQWWA